MSLVERIKEYVRSAHIRMKDYGKSNYSKEEIAEKEKRVNQATEQAKRNNPHLFYNIG
jgi:hypothetical protein